jgi:hypothetical protein
MSSYIYIFVAITLTLILSVVNIFLHFMPYSAPPVILMLGIALTLVIEKYFQKKT